LKERESFQRQLLQLCLLHFAEQLAEQYAWPKIVARMVQVYADDGIGV